VLFFRENHHSLFLEQDSRQLWLMRFIDMSTGYDLLFMLIYLETRLL